MFLQFTVYALCTLIFSLIICRLFYGNCINHSSSLVEAVNNSPVRLPLDALELTVEAMDRDVEKSVFSGGLE